MTLATFIEQMTRLDNQLNAIASSIANDPTVIACQRLADYFKTGAIK